MSLAAVLERSRQDREAWRYTDLEALLKKVAATRSNDATSILPVPASHATRVMFVKGAAQAIPSLPEGVIKDGAANPYHLSLSVAACQKIGTLELVIGADADMCAFHLDLAAGARLNLIEYHYGVANTQQPHITESEFHLAAAAELSHTKILLNGASAHLARSHVMLETKAQYKNFALIRNTNLVRNEIKVELNGPHAHSTLNGVMLLRAAEHADTFTHTVHAAPHGTSRQLYKSIIMDSAKGAFQGKIIVAKDAQKTNGQQLSRALLLSDRAEMNAKPELEIYADDVSCSHGCTVGDLDTQAMFYLRSRGLDQQQARALLMRAFIDDVIDATLTDSDPAFGILNESVRGWFDDIA